MSLNTNTTVTGTTEPRIPGSVFGRPVNGALFRGGRGSRPEGSIDRPPPPPGSESPPSPVPLAGRKAPPVPCVCCAGFVCVSLRAAAHARPSGGCWVGQALVCGPPPPVGGFPVSGPGVRGPDSPAHCFPCRWQVHCRVPPTLGNCKSSGFNGKEITCDTQSCPHYIFSVYCLLLFYSPSAADTPLVSGRGAEFR